MEKFLRIEGLAQQPMKIRYKRKFVLPSLALLLLAIAALAFGQSAPQPVLSIVTTNQTQILLTITNGVSSTNYEIYRTPLLNNTNFPWVLHAVGDIGQTNFTLDMNFEDTGFFRAGVGSDWDLDGIPNSQDANPLDATIGILSITIDSPTNGATLN
jgi:hypothetical protein